MSHLGSDKFSEKTFEKFRKYIQETCGVIIANDKKTHLSNRLRKRIKELNLPDYDEYWEYLTRTSEKNEENLKLFEVVTINESYFQRGARHYKILSEFVFPEFYKQKRSEVSIWSCGVSTGEEAYDLSLLSIEFEKIHPDIKIKIIGTDVSNRVLEFARKGEYADRKIDQLTEAQLNEYFNPISPSQSSLTYAKKVIAVKPFLKEKVTFQYHNILCDEFLTNVDVIFCRNVLIYFCPKDREEIISRFYSSLNPGGYLFLGHSEALQFSPKNFSVQHFSEGTIYIKKT